MIIVEDNALGPLFCFMISVTLDSPQSYKGSKA